MTPNSPDLPSTIPVRSLRRSVPLDEAIARIGTQRHIHTFMQCGPMLIGADHQRDEVIRNMKKFGVEESGEQASAMGHTLVIVAYPTLDAGRTTPLWIEARPAARETADAQLIAAAPDLLLALQLIMGEPHGCPMCDSGKLRNSEKEHWDSCGFARARTAIAKAEGR